MTQDWPTGPVPDTTDEAYETLRRTCNGLEHLLEHNAEGLSDKALKRMDKAITVMKVGFKIMKKAIKKTEAKPKLRVVA